MEHRQNFSDASVLLKKCTEIVTSVVSSVFTPPVLYMSKAFRSIDCVLCLGINYQMSLSLDTVTLITFNRALNGSVFKVLIERSGTSRTGL